MTENYLLTSLNNFVMRVVDKMKNTLFIKVFKRLAGDTVKLINHIITKKKF